MADCKVLHDWAAHHGGTSDNTGVVRHFGNPEAEYRAAIHTAAVADLSARGRLEITGDDRARFLHNLCTNEVVAQLPGHGCETFFLDVKGHVQDFATLFVGEQAMWLDVEPERAQPLLNHLDHYLIREKVRLQDCSDHTVQLHLTGARAGEILSRLSQELPVLEAPYRHGSARLDESWVAIRRHDRAPVPGYDLIVPAAQGVELWETLLQYGADQGLVPMGADALEVLRIEAGFPKFGQDIGPANLPQEVNRNDQALSFHKGCYLGQETVARLEAMGHLNKRLSGLVLDQLTAIPSGGAVERDGKNIGTLTSCVYSPGLGKAVGLAVLRLSAKPGAAVGVQTPQGTVSAVVTALPFSQAR